MSAQTRDRHKEMILKLMQRCVHFTGIQHDSCKAGVNYHAQFGTGAGCFANIACVARTDGFKECPQAKYPTREEAEAEDKEHRAMTQRFVVACNAAHDDAKAKGLRKGKGGLGDMPCPICKTGTLRYSVAGYNGHMHAKCSTTNCVSWME